MSVENSLLVFYIAEFNYPLVPEMIKVSTNLIQEVSPMNNSSYVI